ncbi:hypothetical protein HMPREF1624_01731 [Sporothrix schenckii ATCC 58251]|uniref:Uncharacterized protein n=1 Tax=Sporothrix schenckii (strain ATCC 58251 / de Perez 2211183) TaxID=1391915 RepID=U7Q9I7_SPOS1|nr:hypothetical protein HMPREF1624_01731 [Sporothrix schenckii ATCC 58251]
MSAPVKVALVTASSAGLGAACVKALAPHFRVVVNYYSRPEKAAEVIREATTIRSFYDLPAGTPRFLALQADVSDRAGIQQLVSEAVDRMGRLDVVVSNAGWTRVTDFMDLEDQLREEDWDRCYNANVKSHLWLLHAAKPFLEQADGGGSLVVVASLAGVRPSGSSVAYAVSKAAAIHLTKCLALVCGPKVRCNAVSPGLLMTEWGRRFSDAQIQQATDKTALRRLATIEDVADQVKTLALSQSMTGQNVVVDGGVAI